jgi:nucleotide-binding universal stress UspA family protein
MQSIIVPTDFSANADHALAYACELANVLKLKIVLFHAYQVPVPVSEMPAVPFSEEDIRKSSLEGLQQTKENFRNKCPGLIFEIETMHGSLELLVNKVTAEYNGKYIVIGTKGASGVAEILLGTNAAAVMEKAICPVICVPENAKFTGLKNIILTADYGQHNFEHAAETIELARPFQAEVTLLHVTSGELEDYFEDRELLLFRNKLVEKSDYTHLGFKLLTDKDVYHGVNSFVEEHGADLLVVSMRTRTIWQKLFHRSLTKRMAYHSHLPVMALHIEENN